MTKADFYIKREGQKELEWIGSCEYETIDKFLQSALEAKEESDYYTNIFESWKDDPEHYTPIHGWPWQWEDSNGTDIAYCFVVNTVLKNEKGTGWKTMDGKKAKNDFKFPKFKSTWHE